MNFFSRVPGWALAVVFCAFAAVLVLGANPFDKQTNAPMGLLAQFNGWHGHDFQYANSHPERSDVLDGLLPVWRATKSSIRNGDNLFWLSKAGGGVPGPLLFTNATLTPAFLVFLLVEDDWLGFYVSNLVKLVLAGFGMFLFLNSFLGKSASLSGSLFFMFCGFHAAWFYWPHMNTSLWIPFVLWAVFQWLTTFQFRWILIFTLVTLLMLLGGFPAVAVYGLYAAGLLSLCLSFQNLYENRIAIVLVSQISLGVALLAVGCFMYLFAYPLWDILSSINLGYRGGMTSPYSFPTDLNLMWDAFAQGLPLVERTNSMGFVAVGLAFLSVFALGSIRESMHKRWMAIWAFSMILLTCSFLITYGLASDSLVSLLPGIGSSSWGRVAIMMNLSVAMLAAIAIEMSVKLIAGRLDRYRRIIPIFFLSLASISVYPQLQMFRAFNQVSHADDFYPMTQSIEHVKLNISPFQSIVADKSFLIGGTLSAYGVKEWFAHSFKSDREKELLSELVVHPFATATSAFFPGEAIRYESDLFQKLGIRYVLTGAGSISPNGGQWLTQRSQSKNPQAQPTPLLSGGSVQQKLRLDVPLAVQAVKVMVATYKQRAQSGLMLKLYNDQEELLAESRVPKSVIIDNQFATFEFAQALDLEAGAYTFEISQDDRNQTSPISLWWTSGLENEGEQIVFRGARKAGAVVYQMLSTAPKGSAKSKWIHIENLESHVFVYENTATPQGAYFISDLARSATISDTGIKTEQTSSNKIAVEYAGDVAGYVVLPARVHPGWKAFINGEEQILLSYLGLLQAVEVDGSHQTITFVYRPPHLQIALLATILGITILFAMFIFSRKNIVVSKRIIQVES
jgi:hypothetical protein